jgi:glycogen operon protein
MGRTPAFRQDAPLFRRSKLSAALAVKLIAEPWDIGEGGYQVGNFPRCLPSGMTISAMRPTLLAAA